MPLDPPHAARAIAHAAPSIAEKANPQGKDLWNKSYYPTGADAENVSKKWYIIDAEGQTLGRLACLASMYIRCVAGPARRLTANSVGASTW